jgi:hypothetical protein
MTDCGTKDQTLALLRHEIRLLPACPKVHEMLCQCSQQAGCISIQIGQQCVSRSCHEVMSPKLFFFSSCRCQQRGVALTCYGHGVLCFTNVMHQCLMVVDQPNVPAIDTFSH